MPNYNEPLGLPQGSVRAIIALVLIVAAVVGVFLGKSDVFITGSASLVVGLYFGKRDSETVGKEKAEAEPEATHIDTDTDEGDRTIVANTGDAE